MASSSSPLLNPPSQQRIQIPSILSPTYLYPFKGLYYFLAHPSFYPFFGRRLIPLTILSVFILGILFTFTYLPQAAFLLIFHGPTAWVSAVFLVLGEGNVIIALLFEGMMVDETLVDVFDATLIANGQERLVVPFRTLRLDAPTPPKQLGKPKSSAVYSPFSFRQIAEFILFLPLNLIPIVGVPFFLLLTGARAGPFHHHRYFKLLSLTRKQKNEEIHKRRWGYTWFGTVAVTLQLVPVLSMFFLLTSACGSALWVVKLEEQKALISDAVGRAVAQGEGDGDDVPPVSYSDDVV